MKLEKKKKSQRIYAAAAAKSLQSCPTLCDPIDGSPQGSLVPGILQARTLASQNIRIRNSFLESLLLEFFPLLGVTIHLTFLRCPPTRCWSLDLLWGQLRFQPGPTPVYSGLQCPQQSELVRFLLWELSLSFYIFHRHRVCLVDCVDLIFSLYSWWEGFESSSCATLPLGFNCGLIFTSACGSSTGVCS